MSLDSKPSFSSRRQFLSASIATLACAPTAALALDPRVGAATPGGVPAITPDPTLAPPAPPMSPVPATMTAPIDVQEPPPGYLLTLGANAELYATGKNELLDRRYSILTSIDIQSGVTKSTPVETHGEGHMAMGLGDGRILCTGHHQRRSLVVDANHETIAIFEAPEPYVYGGHGLVLKDRNIFILPMRHRKPMSAADTGRLQVYDLTTLKLLNQVDSGGVHPHEPQLIAGTDEIIVSHYGDIHVPTPPFEHNVVDGKLTIYDAKTLAIKRHYDQTDLKAMTTHMQVNNDGFAYFVLTQYVRPDFQAAQGNMALAFAGAHAAMEKLTGKVRDYPVPYLSYREMRLAVPLPLVRVNTQTGERKIIMTDPANHLRGQTVGFNSLTNTAVATFYHSDKIILHKGDETPVVVDGAHVGLEGIRGVTDIPGTPYVALSGAFRHVAIMNVNDHSVIRRIRSDNYYSVHVGFSPKLA